MVLGLRMYATYCPVTEKAQQSVGKRKKTQSAMALSERDARSVLESIYEPELRQKTGYQFGCRGKFTSTLYNFASSGQLVEVS